MRKRKHSHTSSARPGAPLRAPVHARARGSTRQPLPKPHPEAPSEARGSRPEVTHCIQSGLQGVLPLPRRAGAGTSGAFDEHLTSTLFARLPSRQWRWTDSCGSPSPEGQGEGIAAVQQRHRQPHAPIGRWVRPVRRHRRSQGSNSAAQLNPDEAARGCMLLSPPSWCSRLSASCMREVPAFSQPRV